MELKIGGKITLLNKKQFRIIEIVEYKGLKYLMCSTTEKPIVPVILEYRVIDGKDSVRLEQNDNILEQIYLKIRKETLNSKP